MQSNVRPLRELCSLIADCPHSTPVWTESGYVVVRNQNIKGGRLDLSSPSFTDAQHFAHRTRRAKPRAGDIIFTREAPMGEVCMVPPGLECCVGQRQVLLRPNPEVVDGRFLLFALQSPQVQREIGWNEGTGSTVSNVRIPVLEALRIPTPPLEIQREIGSILEALDHRIDLLGRTNATLESIAQALFKSWFIDFDPVRAKAEGREPEGMDAATAALFPAEFEESDLGLIPKDWTVSTVADLCARVSNGGTPSRSKPSFWTDGTVPWFKTGELFDTHLLHSTERITSDAVASTSVKVLPRHAVLMAIYAAPTVGRLGVLTGEAAFNQACTGMLAKPVVGPWFLFQTLFHGRKWFNSRANGAAQQNISKAIVESYQCIRPTLELLGAFNELAGGLYASAERNALQAQTLTELRDTLLPRLISGKLRIPEAQAQLEEAIA